MSSKSIFFKPIAILITFLGFNFISILTVSAQKKKDNLSYYNYESNADHLGFHTSLGFNTGMEMRSLTQGSVSTSVALSPLFLIGTYYQYHFLKNTFVRGGLDIGFNAHRFKYALYNSKSDTTWGTFDKPSERVGMTTPVFRINVGLGQRFHVTEKHIIEFHANIVMEKYLSKNVVEPWDTVKSNTVLSNTDKIDYLISTRRYWSKEKWGSLNGEFYLGYRNRGHDNFTERLAFGLFYYTSLNKKELGYTDIVYYDNKYKYESGKQRILKHNATIGVRIAFELF